MALSPDSSELLAIAGLATAVCALVATIWQGVVTRKHNRLSVKPVLTLYREESDGKIYIKNNGTGPALIRDYELYKDGRFVDERNVQSAIPLLARAASLTNGVALAPGDTIDLIESKTYMDGTHVPPLEALRFRIRYASIYGETWTLE